MKLFTEASISSSKFKSISWLCDKMVRWCNCIPHTNVRTGDFTYGLIIVTPRPQTFHRSHDNLINPYRIASIFYMYIDIKHWGNG